MSDNPELNVPPDIDPLDVPPASSGPVVDRRPPGRGVRDRLAGAMTRGRGRGGGVAFGALALGAFAVGALAIGTLAIGRLVVGRARIRTLQIDRLIIGSIEEKR